MASANEIEILMRSKYPILYVVSWEERRVEASLDQISKNLKRTLHTWSYTQGMKPPVPSKSNKLVCSLLFYELKFILL